MKVVSRVTFPKTAETSEVYMKLDAGTFIDFQASNSQIILSEGSSISLNTYFNSIYEIFYTKYTTLSSLYYLLKLEGDFEVSAYRERYEASTKELILSKKLQQCQLSDNVKILLPELKQTQEAGRIYLEITCLSEQGLFTEGLVVTEQEKHRDVSLGIITCTYKKEAYVKNTVNAILQDSFLHGKNFKIFVVDNGKTLNKSDFEDSRVQLISNRNVGGSGGFTKGLIEALQEGVYTHFLFMDDDIELDSEAIYRLFSLYEYAKQDFAVAGSMLDLHKKHILYEAGALYNKYFDDKGNLQYHPFLFTGLKHNVDLRNPTSLNLLLMEDNIDYGGFWFFCCSQEVVKTIGLPLPFFIKIDDMEFGLRINEHLENGIVAFPSLAVWHDPFYAKNPGWDVYYEYRNQLINHAIHNLFTYFETIKTLTKNIIDCLLIFDYNSAKMIVKGFEDYMQGPSFMRSHDPELLHSSICEYSKIHKSENILTNSISNSDGYQITKAGTLQKVVSLLTLNGHFLPKFLISDETAIIRYGSKERDSLCKGFAKKRVIFIKKNHLVSSQNELDNKAGINILIAWIKSIIKSSLKWSYVSAEWKKAAKDLTSLQFWQNYLEPQNKTESQHPNYVKPGEAA
ncbi:glycosyltransferase [Scytonema sp. PCC 10023]|uniref:glycosyltransferase n=1 Tax=Scytonema sp. PCC 10023 TaxID=1680591 RepID=UPI0039C6AF09